MNREDYRTPGQLIKDLLIDRGWTHQLLASVLDLDRSIISKIIKGNRSVNAELAIALGEVFNEAPERFMDLQMSFDLAQARIVVRPDPKRAKRANLLSQLPVSEMMKRGWMKEADIKNLNNIEDSVNTFFGLEGAEDIEVLPHAAKKANACEAISYIQLTWLYRVKQLAKEMLVPTYSKAKLVAAIKKLNALKYSAEETRNVPHILASAGVRFVLVEGLKNSKIDGVCFWLDDKSPVVGLSLRFDRIDNFWFVLRHELEHVLKGDGKIEVAIDHDLEGTNGGDNPDLPDFERNANLAAAEFCVPQDLLSKFIRMKDPLFSEKDIRGFAKIQHIHPGLIAGQIQRYTGRYEIFRKFLAPVRKHISPSALVDGWGDIPPTN